MAFKVKKIDHEAVKRQLQSGVYDNAPQQKTNNVTKFQNYLKTDQGQANFQNQLDNSSYVQGNLAKLKQSQQQPAPVVQQSQPAQQSQPMQQSNSNSLINSIYSNSRDAQLQALRKAQETAQQSLNREETGAKQHAYDTRNQADVTASQNAQRLREAMANMGLSSSGDNLTLQAGQNAQRQGALGSINRDEGNRLQNILEQRGVIDNNMAKDEQALIQQLNAVRAQQQLQQAEADRQFGLQEGGLTGQYQGQQTQEAQNQQFNQSMATNQFGAQEQQRGLDNQFRQDSFEYTKAQNDWENTFRNQQFDFQKAQQLWDNNFQNKNFAQSANQFAQSMGMQQQNLNQRGKEFLAEMTYKNEAMQMNKDEAAQRKFETDVAHAFKRREFSFMENQANQTTTKTADEYFDAFDNSPNVTNGNVSGTEAEILALQIPDAEIRRLYDRYSIPME